MMGPHSFFRRGSKKRQLKFRTAQIERLESRELLAVTAGTETFADSAIFQTGTPSETEINFAGMKPTEAQLAAPVILTGGQGIFPGNGANSHKILWSSVSNVSTYELAYSTNGVDWKSTYTSGTSAVIGNLPYGSSVQYKVRALGSGANSDSGWSEVKEFCVCPTDIDGDGFVGPGDRAYISSAWFSMEGDDNWDPACDLDSDGFVGPGDLSFISASWFRTVDEIAVTSLALNYTTGKVSLVNASNSGTDILRAGDKISYKFSENAEYGNETVLDSGWNSFLISNITTPGTYTVWVKVQRPGTQYDWLNSLTFTVREEVSNVGLSFDGTNLVLAKEGASSSKALQEGDVIMYKTSAGAPYGHSQTISADTNSFNVAQFTEPGTYTVWVQVIRPGAKNIWTKSISFTVQEPNVTPSDMTATLKWNTSVGGLDLAWTATNTFRAEAVIDVYFASGSSYSGRVSESLQTLTIPYGTTAGSTGTLHIDRSALISTLDSTTFDTIIVCLSDKVLTSIADVKLTVSSGVDKSVVNQSTYDAIKSGMRATGISTLTLTSGWRQPADQARAMYGNLARSDVKGAISYQYSLYASAGDQVIAVFEAKAIEYGYNLSTIQAHATEIKQLMTDKINELNARGIRVSRHCVSRADYIAHNIVDVGRGPFNSSNIPIFTEAVKKCGSTKVLDEPANGCLHIEF